MIYEIRLYTVVPGRISVAYERFGKHLPRLFARHGIRNVGCWTATAGACGPMFVYMMAYHDIAERERQWANFYGDAEWYEVRARTQRDEEATERFAIHFLRTGPVWAPAAADRRTLGGVHDLLFAEVALGKNSIANKFLTEVYLPLVRKAGAEIMMVADFITGPRLPRIAMMFAWPDPAIRETGWHRISEDQQLTKAFAEQRKSIGRAAIGPMDTFLLEPAPFALPLATLGNPL